MDALCKASKVRGTPKTAVLDTALVVGVGVVAATAVDVVIVVVVVVVVVVGFYGQVP